MGKTSIEWTDMTWNPITGCSIKSKGCNNCYAMGLAATRLKHHPSRKGLTQEVNGHHVWTGEVRFNRDWLDQPLRWKKPSMVFVCAHGDLFHENVPDEWIDCVFAIMALCPRHTFQILTKRPERMREYLSNPDTVRRIYMLVCDKVLDSNLKVALIAPGTDDSLAPPAPRIHLDAWPLRNVWLGTSVEDQDRADERIPALLATLAAIRWISAEPLLGPVNLNRVSFGKSDLSYCIDPSITKAEFFVDALKGAPVTGIPGLDWVVVGGESGSTARPMHPHWAETLRVQCLEAGVPFTFKQWGAWVPALQFPATVDDEPEQSRFASVVWDGTIWDMTNGHWTDSENWHIARDGDDPFQQMFKVGKKAAGRLLDGVIHDAMPGVT